MENVREIEAELHALLVDEFGEAKVNEMMRDLDTENETINNNLFNARSDGLCVFLKACGISDQKAQHFLEVVLFNDELMKSFNLIYIILKNTGGVHIFPETMSLASFRIMLFDGVTSVFMDLIEKCLGKNLRFHSATLKEQLELEYSLAIVFNAIIFGKEMVNPVNVDRAEYHESMPEKDLPEVRVEDFINERADIFQYYFAEAA